MSASLTPANIEAYMANLTGRVSSVTAWNNVYKVRRAAELIAPSADFAWLREIENDLAFVMQSRSKLDRLVLTEQLVEAGLTLIAEAQEFASTEIKRARGIRNGLMLCLLAQCPVREKNFAALEIGRTFKEIRGRWWILLPSRETKNRRAEDRPVPDWLNSYVELYLNKARPVLLSRSKSSESTNSLWISSNTGNR